MDVVSHAYMKRERERTHVETVMSLKVGGERYDIYIYVYV